MLCFERPDDGFGTSGTDFVAADRLGERLASYTVPLVILEACRSSTMSKTAVSGSIAPRLIQAGVGSVLAMSHAVHVETTRLLLDRFYQELVRGTTIGQAMAQAREVLRTKPVRWIESGPVGSTIELQDWFLPQLYQRAADEALVPPGANDETEGARLRESRSPATRDESGAFPPPPQFGFRGRAHELHVLERLFRTRRGIVLHAMGGMGKTALATEAAHWWTRSGLFRDGACFLSFEQFANADRAVQVLGTYLAGPKFDQLPAVEQRRRAIELFQQNDVLMVWDNFESALPQFNDGASPYTEDERHRLAELFRDLTTGSGKGCLLVTCRPGDTGLPGALRCELQGLARADSLWLLASILRRDGLTLADPRLSRDKLDPLLRDLADHPLSLELVGPHLRDLTPEEIRADFGKLLAKFQQEAPEGRNQSLLASLELSRRHLSPAAREAMPWLGLFSGGVFEKLLLNVSQLASETWESIRQELRRVALLRIESDLQLSDRPFLRFHPTLAAAVADPTLAQSPEIRQRFLGIYLALMQGLDNALKGAQSRAALEVLNREEANYRTAVQWAVADQQLTIAADLGDTFCEYLQRSGRFRERDAWVKWLRNAVGQQGFTKEAAEYERQHAWTLAQGDPRGAVDQLQSLIERLRHTSDFDPAFELAATTFTLGRVLDHAGASAQAIPILRQAVSQWEALAAKAGGLPWEDLLASPDHMKAVHELNNLSATIGDLANALSSAGQYNEALAFAEKCGKIQEKQGNHLGVASAHAQCASILMEAGRYGEADARYGLALAAALQLGDKGLEANLLQHQGRLADNRNQLDQATCLYHQAIKRFWEAGDHQGLMQTYNLLGVVEQKVGRLAEARAWHKKLRELALQLKEQASFGDAAQNIGIICQLEGEAARERGDEPAARRHFEEARLSVEESLEINHAFVDKLHEANSWGQLAQIHLHLGDLAAAAECAKKRDDLLTELKRRAGGAGG